MLPIAGFDADAIALPDDPLSSRAARRLRPGEDDTGRATHRETSLEHGRPAPARRRTRPRRGAHVGDRRHRRPLRIAERPRRWTPCACASPGSTATTGPASRGRRRRRRDREARARRHHRRRLQPADDRRWPSTATPSARRMPDGEQNVGTARHRRAAVVGARRGRPSRHQRLAGHPRPPGHGDRRDPRALRRRLARLAGAPAVPEPRPCAPSAGPRGRIAALAARRAVAGPRRRAARRRPGRAAGRRRHARALDDGIRGARRLVDRRRACGHGIIGRTDAARHGRRAACGSARRSGPRCAGPTRRLSRGAPRRLRPPRRVVAAENGRSSTIARAHTRRMRLGAESLVGFGLRLVRGDAGSSIGNAAAVLIVMATTACFVLSLGFARTGAGTSLIAQFGTAQALAPQLALGVVGSRRRRPAHPARADADAASPSSRARRAARARLGRQRHPPCRARRGASRRTPGRAARLLPALVRPRLGRSRRHRHGGLGRAGRRSRRRGDSCSSRPGRSPPLHEHSPRVRRRHRRLRPPARCTADPRVGLRHHGAPRAPALRRRPQRFRQDQRAAGCCGSRRSERGPRALGRPRPRRPRRRRGDATAARSRRFPRPVRVDCSTA